MGLTRRAVQVAAGLSVLLAWRGASAEGSFRRLYDEASAGESIDDQGLQVAEGEIPFVFSQPGAEDEGAEDTEDDDDVPQGVQMDEEHVVNIAPHAAGLHGRNLVIGGQVQSGFSCSQPARALATDGADVDTRRLQFAVVPGAKSDTLSQLAQLTSGLWSEQQLDEGGEDDDALEEVDASLSAEGALLLSDARLQIYDVTGSISSSLMEAAFDGDPNQLVMSEGQIETVAILYNCFAPGEAVVEARFNFARPGGQSVGEICMRWRKQCAWGWHHLEIRHGSQLVLQGNDVHEQWRSKMNDPGTTEDHTRFTIFSDGVLRLRPPVLFEENPLVLDVEMRGPAVGLETFETTEVQQSLTVIYKCLRAGSSKVKLWLEQDHWSDDGIGGGQRIELSWIKVCPESQVKAQQDERSQEAILARSDLQVALFSETWQNQTQAVRNGLPLPGFERPRSRCRKSDGSCPKTPPILALPRRDKTTRIEMRMTPWTGQEPVVFSPPPSISYDRKVLVITVSQWPRRVDPDDPSLLFMELRYVCFVQGVSNVTLSLHMPGYDILDFAWQKKCRQPVAKVNNDVLTAPQALTGAMMSLLLLGIACWFAGRKLLSGGGGGSGGSGAVSKLGKPSGGSRDQVMEEQVMYHG